MSETAASLDITYALTVRAPQLVPKGSNPNGREHWAAKARRVKGERFRTRLALAKYIPPYVGKAVTVTLTRCALRLVRDRDNLIAQMKACQDEVARWLGRDDSDPLVTWVVEQQKATRKTQGTVIRVEAKR